MKIKMPKIRRKAYNMNNPALHAGLRSHLHTSQLRSELNYVVPEGMDVISYPELHFVYSGLFTFKTSGLAPKIMTTI